VICSERKREVREVREEKERRGEVKERCERRERQVREALLCSALLFLLSGLMFYVKKIQVLLRFT